MQVGQQCVLGSSPYTAAHRQNALVLQLSWTWVSMPITASNCTSASAPVFSEAASAEAFSSVFARVGVDDGARRGRRTGPARRPRGEGEGPPARIIAAVACAAAMSTMVSREGAPRCCASLGV